MTELEIERDPEEFFAELAQTTHGQMVTPSEDGGPVFAGTFAFYPDERGGLVVVLNLDRGPVLGPQRTRLPPAMLKLLSSMVSGDRRGMLRALMPGGRRKQREIEG